MVALGLSSAAAAVGKPLQMPAKSIEDAICIARTQVDGLKSAKEESTMKRMQHSFALRSGLLQY